jgi:light-regulated signal transduction histidine kinase (bacteriophytochrome)
VNELKEALRAEYNAILHDYLEKMDEVSLQRAYEFGRKAIESKLGILEVTECYNHALVNICRHSVKEPEEVLPIASQILSTSLAPFEMTHRGFEDSIRNLQKMAKDLAEANNELESFSYSISHDLRAPLRAVMGFADVLVQESGSHLSASAKNALSRIVTNANNMNALIDDMLKLAKMVREELTVSNVALSDMVREILAELEVRGPREKILLSIAPNVSVRGDARLLRIALTNLLSNAWKFTSKQAETKITFGFEEQDGERIYFIRDNGAGFDKRRAARLFTPFQRFHSDQEYEGTGIGLSTVQRVIKKHSGRIWAEAQPNQGASFYFTLKP